MLLFFLSSSSLFPPPPLLILPTICRCVHVLEGHVSAVTSLGFAEDGATMLRYEGMGLWHVQCLLPFTLTHSGGRDKVVHVWELASGSLRKTFPIFEASPRANNLLYLL